VRSPSDYRLIDGVEVLAFVGMVALTYGGPLLGGYFWYAWTRDPDAFEDILRIGPLLVLSLIGLGGQMAGWALVRGKVSRVGLTLNAILCAGLLILLVVSLVMPG
jgi:hypothetical protein